MPNRIQLKSKANIVFTGDSITDCERLETPYQPFGFGYVHFAANMLLAKYPELELNIVNTGIGGNTTTDLLGRWQRDVIDHRPDILSVLIGINDLWRQHKEDMQLAVYPDQFEANYRAILSEAREKCDPQIVLMEPFMFCCDVENAMLRGLGEYIEIVDKLAAEFDAVLIEPQTMLKPMLTGPVPAEKWADDMVHPFIWVHAWLAQIWLKGTGLR